MKANKIVLVILPGAMMVATMFAMTGIETWLAGFGKSEAAKLAVDGLGSRRPTWRRLRSVLFCCLRQLDRRAFAPQASELQSEAPRSS